MNAYLGSLHSQILNYVPWISGIQKVFDRDTAKFIHSEAHGWWKRFIEFILDLFELLDLGWGKPKSPLRVFLYPFKDLLVCNHANTGLRLRAFVVLALIFLAAQAALRRRLKFHKVLLL